MKPTINLAAEKYGEFLTLLGFDWESDPNMKDTPKRVAKMYINELYRGCYDDSPKITAFDNTENYTGIVFEGNITVQSVCSHHIIPFIGNAHVAYIPTKKIIGLSKLNRIVEYYCRRPQVQENLTQQIHNHISEICEGNGGVAVMIEAKHLCVSMRGVSHSDGIMKTAKLSGAFLKQNELARTEFYNFIAGLKNG